MSERADARPRNSAWLGLAVALVVWRVGHAVLAPPYPDELYHWVLSSHPAPSYLDHPALTHALVGGGAALWGASVGGLRAGTVLCGLAWMALLPALLRRLRPGLDSRGRGDAILLVAAAPPVVAASVLAMPYAPLMLGWTACLLGVLDGEREAGRSGWRGWMLAGLGAALATWSQASAPLLLGVVGLWLLLARRDALARPAPWGGLALWAAAVSPLLLWSAEHGWAPWAFQALERHEPAWHPEHIGEFAAGQLLLPGLLLGPWLAVVLAGRLRQLWRGPAEQRATALLVLLSCVLVALPFGVAAAHSDHWNLHWTLPAFALALPDAAAALQQARRGWRLAVLVTTLGLSALLVAVHVLSGHAIGFSLLGDPFRMAQHDELAACVRREWELLPEPRLLIAAEYQTASLVHWQHPDLPVPLEWGKDGVGGPDYPRLFPLPADERGWNAIFVGRRRSGRTEPVRRAGLEAAFTWVLDPKDVPERFTVLRCLDFGGR